MANKLTRDILLSDLGAVNALIEATSTRDPLGALSLNRRREDIQAQLAALDAEPHTLASVALVFDGGPVRGSYGIDADFAGRALQDYQELVAKQLASSEAGGLARREPVPDRKQARMNVTSVVHGSFGFLLEEDLSDEPQFIESALKGAVEKVGSLLVDVVAVDANRFNTVLDSLDTRLFQTLKRFVGSLHKEDSTLKIVDETKEIMLDHAGIERAHQRIQEASVEEEDIYVTGELLGIVPIQRRFDFQPSDGGDIIKGKVGERLSADYLERIHSEQVAGRVWLAVIHKRVIRHPDRREKIEFTLVDLTEPPAAP